MQDRGVGLYLWGYVMGECCGVVGHASVGVSMGERVPVCVLVPKISDLNL